jgi:hypothetical protein
MKDGETRFEIQSRYENIFNAYNERCPAPVANCDPRDYQYDLMRLAKQKLSRADDRQSPIITLRVSVSLPRRRLRA